MAITNEEQVFLNEDLKIVLSLKFIKDRPFVKFLTSHHVLLSKGAYFEIYDLSNSKTVITNIEGVQDKKGVVIFKKNGFWGAIKLYEN